MPKRCCVSSVYVPCVPQRYVMCVLGFAMTTISFMMYHCSYSMLNEIIALPYVPQIYRTDHCQRSPRHESFFDGSKKNARVYWTRQMKKHTMQSTIVGYAISNVASGILADMFGPKVLWGLGTLLTSFISFLIPLACTVSPYVLFVSLFFAGLGLGVIVPCSSVLVAHWAPENERTAFMAYIMSGSIVALMIDFVFHEKVLVMRLLWESWEDLLYSSAVLGIVWVLVWYFLFYNRPAEHPHLPKEQLQYIRARTTGVSIATCPRDRYMPVVPWKQILLSPPFLSLFSFNLADSWINSITFFQISTYVSEVIDITVLFNGGQTIGMILGVGLVSVLVHGWICDKLISTGLTTRTANRLFFLLFSKYLCAVLLLIIPLIGCDAVAVTVAILVFVHIHGMAFASVRANVVDLSPRYAGILQGILEACGSLTVLFSRQLCGLLVEDAEYYKSWEGYFQISAISVIILASPYACFGSGDMQTWNYHVKKTTTQGSPIPTNT